MADVPGKASAQSFTAGVASEKGLSPLQWSDKCFLCSTLIEETDPRGFYSGSNAMMLCHRGCLIVMETHGGKPEDYHRAVEAKKNPPVVQGGVPSSGGPGWLEFPNLAALQAYTRLKGDIPDTVKVTVAGKVVQDQQ